MLRLVRCDSPQCDAVPHAHVIAALLQTPPLVAAGDDAAVAAVQLPRVADPWVLGVANNGAHAPGMKYIGHERFIVARILFSQS
jgi:hypothetical protein